MLKEIWKFLWEGESLLSYILFIVVSFIALKFIFYPAFLYIFGLEDIVSVLTGSMIHDGYHPQWYLENNFSLETVESWPFQSGLNIGDAVIILPPDDIVVGDVVVFKTLDNKQVIHRVVEINENGITTHGDANRGTLDFEKNISLTKIIGEAKFRIPLIGIPRMLLFRILGF